MIYIIQTYWPALLVILLPIAFGIGCICDMLGNKINLRIK